MSIDLNLTLRGQTKAIETLRLIMKRADDPSRLVARLSVIGFQDVMDHFRKEEGAKRSGDTPYSWARLSPITIAMRRQGRGPGGHKILQDTGRLRGSIIPGTRGSKRAFVSTNLFYAATHQYGRGNIPARPFMWISRSGLDKMHKVALDWVMHGRAL